MVKLKTDIKEFRPLGVRRKATHKIDIHSGSSTTGTVPRVPMARRPTPEGKNRKAEAIKRLMRNRFR